MKAPQNGMKPAASSQRAASEAPARRARSRRRASRRGARPRPSRPQPRRRGRAARHGRPAAAATAPAAGGSAHCSSRLTIFRSPGRAGSSPRASAAPAPLQPSGTAASGATMMPTKVRCQTGVTRRASTGPRAGSAPEEERQAGLPATASTSTAVASARPTGRQRRGEGQPAHRPGAASPARPGSARHPRAGPPAAAAAWADRGRRAKSQSSVTAPRIASPIASGAPMPARRQARPARTAPGSG